jgi:hypothetical protein
MEEHRRVDRRRRRGFVATDRVLLEVMQTHTLRTSDDLWQILADLAAQPFDTKELAEANNCPRWYAQQIAYCLRLTGACETVGKRRGAWLYNRLCNRNSEAA